MRIHNGMALAATLLLAMGGCATTRPCVIIPRQLEMARWEAEQMEKQVEAKAAEVTSLTGNLEMVRTRLANLEQEAAELEMAIAAAAADSAASGGKQ